MHMDQIKTTHHWPQKTYFLKLFYSDRKASTLEIMEK